MLVYVYQACLLCELCGLRVKSKLDAKHSPDTEDSDHYPQGPYSDGGGEADLSQLCAICGVALGNPLTGDGEQREQH